MFPHQHQCNPFGEFTQYTVRCIDVMPYSGVCQSRLKNNVRTISIRTDIRTFPTTWDISSKTLALQKLGCSHASIMPTGPTPTAVLRASLERHNDVFESLLKLIPAQFYIVNDETEDQVWQIPSLYYCWLKTTQVASKYQKHSKKQKAPKQAIKEASKKAKLDKVLFDAQIKQY
jgi:hypothetical protein